MAREPIAFLSPEPVVHIENAFARPYENAVATARTCYSPKGVIRPQDVSGDHLEDEDKRRQRAEKRDGLARDIFKAGHHTTFQHAHIQFSLANVSRQFIWSFLHSHPFYNSEQVSQRYVEVKADQFAVPPLEKKALGIYRSCLERQMAAYRQLIELLTPPVEERYFRLYPSRRRRAEEFKGAVQKRAQEVARYVLPVAAFAYLYHTVSAVTLLRYWKLCRAHDAPSEQYAVVRKMVEALLKLEPLYRNILEEPYEPEEFPEFAFLNGGGADSGENTARFRSEFDAMLGGRVSRLVDWKSRNEEILAQAVREVYGLPKSALGDGEAIDMALNPARNTMLAATLNVTTHSKLSRALFHPSYTFAKKLSHTADSQDQRHRMTPASRPCLSAFSLDEPDYITPMLVNEQGGAVKQCYDDAMQSAWEAVRRLRESGVEDEFAAYLLPNAVALRFTESADLLNLHHKHKMRLCYNAQEEIWKASLEEALQITEVNPRIGRWLLPPCGIHDHAGIKPVCPEGNRFCGVRVWTMQREDYVRTL
jgi:thymidylate synthase ThyX